MAGVAISLSLVPSRVVFSKCQAQGPRLCGAILSEYTRWSHEHISRLVNSQASSFKNQHYKPGLLSGLLQLGWKKFYSVHGGQDRTLLLLIPADEPWGHPVEAQQRGRAVPARACLQLPGL